MFPLSEQIRQLMLRVIEYKLGLVNMHRQTLERRLQALPHRGLFKSFAELWLLKWLWHDDIKTKKLNFIATILGHPGYNQTYIESIIPSIPSFHGNSSSMNFTSNS